MIYHTRNMYQGIWHDELEFMKWQADQKVKRYVISKKKLLSVLATVDELTMLHMLILDNLSRLYSIYYYTEDEKFVLSLEKSVSVTTKAKSSDFEEIFLAAVTQKQQNA